MQIKLNKKTLLNPEESGISTVYENKLNRKILIKIWIKINLTISGSVHGTIYQ